MTTQKIQSKNQKKNASVIVVTYNSIQFLDACLHSILCQRGLHELIIVDNCSEDETVSYVREHFPEVKVIKNSSNAGYGAGNNLGVEYATGEFIVILNPDTIVQKGWLSALIAPLEGEGDIITTSKILTYYGLTINTCGNINHLTGLNFTRGLGESPEQYQEPASTGGISGACFAIRKRDYLLLGGFDEAFFLYNEDSDFSWNAFQSGYTIKYIPDSVVHHNYVLSVSPDKLYHLEKGRYIIIRKYFSGTDIFLLLPSLAIAELLTWGYCLKHGKRGVINKIKALNDGVRQPIKKSRYNMDSLLKHLDPQIPDSLLITNRFEKFIIGICNKIFSLNLNMMLRKTYRVNSGDKK